TTMARYGLTPTGSRRTTVNGLQAIMTQAKQVYQNQSTGSTSTNLVLSYFISHGGLIYVFHGVSTEADFNTYATTMNTAMATFSNLTEASKINVQPKRIKVVKVARAGTVADAFNYFRVPQAQHAEFALLNDLELTDKVAAGKLLKIVSQ
ncbi:MAG: peptidase M48, partial [Bacteroidales bacterium]|nr:peptidase M48 [Bacteroidales bacterium]